MNLNKEPNTIKRVTEVVDFVNRTYVGDEHNEDYYRDYEQPRFYKYEKDGVNDTAFVFNMDYLLVCVRNDMFFAIEDDGYYYFRESRVFNSIKQTSISSIVILLMKMNQFVTNNGIPSHFVGNSDYMLDAPEFMKGVCGFSLGFDSDKAFVDEWKTKRPERLRQRIDMIDSEIESCDKIIKKVDFELGDKESWPHADEFIKEHEKKKRETAINRRNTIIAEKNKIVSILYKDYNASDTSKKEK